MPSKKAPKREPGRPRVDPQADTVTMNIRFSTGQRDKIARHGGAAWVRTLVDRAKDTARKG